MNNPWFRFYTEAVDDEKLRLLAFEDRWHYVALLCCKGNGILDSDCSPDMLRRKLSVKLGLALRDFDEAMRRLSEVDLIDPETLQPYGWDNRQFVSDSSKDRTRKWREKQRLRKTRRKCDVTVTVQDTDTDTDTEVKKDTSLRSVSKKGTRLPDGWMPSPLSDTFKTNNPNVTRELANRELPRFRDYWTAKAGKEATKLDWDATWRNWLSRAGEKAPARQSKLNLIHDWSRDDEEITGSVVGKLPFAG